MKSIATLFLLSTTLIFFAFTSFEATKWEMSEEFSLKFSTKKAKGSFNTIKGDIKFDENNLSASSFDIIIDVNSIKTGNFLKNTHAKGPKWFDADQYPDIIFRSQEINKNASGYEVTGILSMHGTEKQITMPFTFEDQIFMASFSVDRTDFNIGATTGMAKSVGHDILLDIKVPVSK